MQCMVLAPVSPSTLMWWPRVALTPVALENRRCRDVGQSDGALGLFVVAVAKLTILAGFA